MNINKDETITLIGAGLVGSLLAVLLAKRGFKVEIFERRSDMRKADISAGRSINLALANRGIFPLQQAGLMDKVWPILTPMKGRMVHDLEGHQNFQSYGQKVEEVIYSVSRGDLNKICMDAAEATGLVTIFFNQKCESVDFDNNLLSLVDAESGDKQTHSFSRLLGTDGSASKIRNAIHAKTSSQHEISPLGHSYKELCILPDEKGDYQLDPHALHIWPRGGYMLIALPNQDKSFTVTLFMPTEGEVSFNSLDSNEKFEDFFAKEFNNALSLMPNVSKDYFENPTGKLATVRCVPWRLNDQALLLGDAAHAIVPFHGQGMNCGFEDAQSLVECIDSIKGFGGDWAQVFGLFEGIRKENADAIADMAIENYITMRDSVRDEKFLLKSALAFELEKRFPKQFCPRYSMVMFHRIPYAVAQTRGVIQESILQELTAQISQLSDVNFEKAATLINQKLSVELTIGESGF